MASYNRIIIAGNLTRDPEYKQLGSGQAVCRLGIASNRQFKNRQSGDMVQEVCYVDIDVWGPQAESCRQYLEKGRAVLVEGRLKLDNWEDQNGQPRSKHSIVADRVVFLGSPAASAGLEVDGGSPMDSMRSAPRGGNNDQRMAPQTEMEKELMSQLDQVKNRAKAAKRAPARSNDDFDGMSGDMSFKDEAPFKDDLPF